MAAKARDDIDWDRMEAPWRAGIVPVLSLSKEYGVSRTSIEKHWEKLGIERDLTAKIKSKAEAIVLKANSKGTPAKVKKGTVPKDAIKYTTSERQIVEDNANIQATVILEEREDVKRLTRICEALEKQLESIAVNPDSEEDLEKKARINKTLIDSRDKVFNMRRRNYGINDNANGDANSDISSQNIEDVRREREEIRRRNGL